MSEHNEELNALGMSKKLLKTTQSTSQILLGDDDITLKSRILPNGTGLFPNTKENLKPGFQKKI
jgi:hypothetical protein